MITSNAARSAIALLDKGRTSRCKRVSVTGKAARTGTYATLRRDMRSAQQAQRERAEYYGMGYRIETAAFYGSGRYAASDDAETRLTIAAADREARITAEHEREEARQYRARRVA